MFNPNLLTRCLTLLLLLAALSGCSNMSKIGSRIIPPPTPPAPKDDPTLIQSNLMDYADTYVNTTTDAYADMSRNVANPAAKRTALSIQLANARGAYINATDDNPLAGLVNMLVLVTLQRQTCDEPWFIETFGTAGDEPRILLTVQETSAWQLAARYLSPDQVQELRDAIATWRKNHPGVRIISLIRLTDFQQARDAAASGKSPPPGSVFSLLFIDPFATLDPAIREVEQTRLAAARMFFYVERMPDLLRWQTEALYMDMLAAPQITSVIDSTAQFTASTSRFTDACIEVANACKQVAADITKFNNDLAAQREAAINQLGTTVATQRDGAITQLGQVTDQASKTAIDQVALATAKERDAAILQLTASVDAIRKSALDQIATVTAHERDAALRQAASTIDEAQKAALANADSAANKIIDRLTQRLILTAFLSALLIAAVMLTYRLLTTRLLPR